MRALLAALPLALLACISPAPVVESQSYAVEEGALLKVAIMPFYPWPELAAAGEQLGGPPPEASDKVALMLSDAISARGVTVVPPDEVMAALAGEWDPGARIDPRAAARIVHRAFGATALVIGEVVRYRERTGEAIGTLQPGSVAFEAVLYGAPSGAKLKATRFDETQRGLSENLLNASRYPGGGTRWLTAEEIARWGARAAAEALTYQGTPPETAPADTEQ